MKKSKTLLRTNVLVCVIIAVGFVLTSIISYRSNVSIYQKDIEHISTLVSEGMYHKITAIFSQPISVSLTMANDNLLKDFLNEEQTSLTDQDYLHEMQNYLDAYRKQYSYDSVFLVSASTNRYYHFNGLDRVLEKGDPENIWYYSLLNSDENYSLNVDNDQTTATNIITVFVNCKITDSSGKVMGIVGVGLQVDSLQALLKEYEDLYHIEASLVDKNGMIEISSAKTGFEQSNLFDNAPYSDHQSAILGSLDTKQTFWHHSGTDSGYMVTQYEPNLKWYLVVENNTSEVNQRLYLQFYSGILIIILIIVAVLFTITAIIKKYNVQLTHLGASQELTYQNILQEMTLGFYENIFEVDITNNRIGGESAKKYVKTLGISTSCSYDKALRAIAQKQIKEDFVQGYLDLFCSAHVMEAYRSGITNLSYDFMFSEDGTTYHWMRVTARIFFWDSDKSIHMITYRQNIDAEKRRELLLIKSVQLDAMTGLYSKHATEELISTTLAAHRDSTTMAAFLIFDIDDFKTVNDTKGHGFGDHVIKELAEELATQVQDCDIAGRVGGDEFVILLENIGDVESLEQKLERICTRLSNKDFGIGQVYRISCSIGVALFPKDAHTYAELYEKADQALYFAKGHGKASFALFDQMVEGRSPHINQRDMGILVDAATSGIAKFAFSTPLALLYFNQKCTELTGVSAKDLSDPHFDPISPIYPDDLELFFSSLTKATHSRDFFRIIFRIQHADGHCLRVKLHGIFINELYENKYPVFYAIFTILDDEQNAK